MERELRQHIIHAGRGPEYRVEVDGYYETVSSNNETQRFVLQFHGCFWHGCPLCFREDRDKSLLSANREDTIDARYQQTLAMTWHLRQRGYQVTEKWECTFDREMRENREMQDFLKNHAMLNLAPLDPRDAFYGRRTGNIATHCEVKGTEKIRYVDVCSLYPYVLKIGAFPIGHPDIYIETEWYALIGEGSNYNFDAVEGLVHCKIFPLRDLFHPVLPYCVKTENYCSRYVVVVAKHSLRLRALTMTLPIVNSWVLGYPANCAKPSRKVISWHKWAKYGNIKLRDTIPVLGRVVCSPNI